jgi:hypothetical protein
VTLVERAGEGLARGLNRRGLLKRGAVAVFGAVAAWTVEGFRGDGALAQTCGYSTDDCSCSPPEGLYCDGVDPSFCAGAACSGGCSYDESFRYAGACWCSAICRYDGGAAGHYQCCDCNCYGQQCACHEFVAADAGQAPPPQGPGGGFPPPPPGSPPFPPPSGEEPPELPPGIPPCFPFCD